MKNWLFNIFLFTSVTSAAQDTGSLVAPVPKSANHVPGEKHSSDVYTSRKWIAGTATAVGYIGSFVVLNKAWYADYPRSPFHSFNDAGEWNQMDKIGHAWTAYSISRLSGSMWQWAGMKKNDAVILGSGSALLYLLSIEYLDGRSTQWGWSWADVAADMFGTGLFAMQELGWGEQRIQLKFSSHPKTYQPSSIQQRADDLFGRTIPERLLKDYNQQTYWLSFNMRSLLQTKKLPAWLNIAIGYGSEDMYGGYENLAFDKNGDISFDRRDIKRYRQWYLAPDIDLTKIKTNSRLLRSLLSIANIIKVPAPALEFSNGKLSVKAIAF